VPRTPISKLVETIVKVETIQEQMVTLAALIEQFSIRLKAVERHVQATTREQG
jgi:vacuolar-type H+-ATPase subunit D/Vma8